MGDDSFRQSEIDTSLGEGGKGAILKKPPSVREVPPAGGGGSYYN